MCVTTPQAEAEARQKRIMHLQREVGQASRQLAEVSEQAAVAGGAHEQALQDVAAMRQQLRLQTQAAVSAARDLDAASHRATVAEADAAGLRRALADCQARHAEQLARRVGLQVLGRDTEQGRAGLKCILFDAVSRRERLSALRLPCIWVAHHVVPSGRGHSKLFHLW